MATDLYQTWLRVDRVVRAHYALQRRHRPHPEADALKVHVLHRMGWATDEIGTHMRRPGIPGMLATKPDLTTLDMLERLIAEEP